MATFRTFAALALLLLVLSACSLDKSGNDDCVGDYGGAGGGTQICSKPPPPQFSQLGQ